MSTALYLLGFLIFWGILSGDFQIHKFSPPASGLLFSAFMALAWPIFAVVYLCKYWRMR
jgi:hypothetical protein